VAAFSGRTNSRLPPVPSDAVKAMRCRRAISQAPDTEEVQLVRTGYRTAPLRVGQPHCAYGRRPRLPARTGAPQPSQPQAATCARDCDAWPRRRGDARWEPDSAIHSSSLSRSPAFCQRSSGDLRGIYERGGRARARPSAEGSRRRRRGRHDGGDELAWLEPVKPLRPVIIS